MYKNKVDVCTGQKSLQLIETTPRVTLKHGKNKHK